MNYFFSFLIDPLDAFVNETKAIFSLLTKLMKSIEITKEIHTSQQHYRAKYCFNTGSLVP